MNRVWPGRSHPLGAVWDGEGTNFAVFAEHATAVELCLFAAPDDGVAAARLPLAEQTAGVWHAYVPDARPGQCYGFRVHGPYQPERGLRFDPDKLLLDPYARAISGSLELRDEHHGVPVGAADPEATRGPRDDAGLMPKSVVVDPTFPWDGDRPPRIPWHETVIYECHVKGMTARHPEVPAPLRGTYLGLATEPVIAHLRGLGVTAVELLPIHHHVTERALRERGLVNYWGYNSIGYFAPDLRYASGGLGEQVTEFRTLVKRLHRAGLEVILDVVYNHTAEGNHLGPTLAFRGLDNPAYYRLLPDDPSRYEDLTGTGNTLNVRHRQTLQLVLDSLRYWVAEMHVDGFRFDIAPVLGRDHAAFDPRAPFFEIVRQDPVLAGVKLVAEPWDLADDGYRLGAFPEGWSEWNGKYRDTVRRFWRGEGGRIAKLASRLAGSSDLFAANGRGPTASINFITCHDGFTLRDLVSYERKHNEANGEDNRDGHDHNYGRNWGVEGPTDVARVIRMRERITRNFFATLAFSQGVPMILHGDELGRTQVGNNNAYCHDGELTWVDWRLDGARRELLEFVRTVLAVRRAHPVLRRRHYFRGERVGPAGTKDVTWLRPDGAEMTEDDWRDARRHALGMLMHGRAALERDERGRPATDHTLLLMLNGGGRATAFTLPRAPERGMWVEVVNTVRPTEARLVRTRAVNLVAHSLILLRYEERP